MAINRSKNCCILCNYYEKIQTFLFLIQNTFSIPQLACIWNNAQSCA